MYYFAYGANTNIDNMNMRCPKAQHVSKISIPNYELVFKTVADIEFKKGATCEGVIWDITTACESALDIYEGFPNLYRKEYFDIVIDDQVHELMFYKMNRDEYGLPYEQYFQTILQGYLDNDLNTDLLYESVEALISPQSISKST